MLCGSQVGGETSVNRMCTRPMTDGPENKIIRSSSSRRLDGCGVIEGEKKTIKIIGKKRLSADYGITVMTGEKKLKKKNSENGV